MMLSSWYTSFEAFYLVFGLRYFERLLAGTFGDPVSCYMPHLLLLIIVLINVVVNTFTCQYRQYSHIDKNTSTWYHVCIIIRKRCKHAQGNSEAICSKKKTQPQSIAVDKWCDPSIAYSLLE